MSHFVLADCNNFYVSCERLFNPQLEGKAVLVLSSNDGCVVARSQEAKQAGIKMGEPYFKIKDFCERMKIIVLSSNYQLYGDLSDRVMSILKQHAPEMEIYSIDEAFLKYPGSSSGLYDTCLLLRKTVKKWVGIPISLGIAPTKTLAKIANDLAKKNREIGVFDLTSPDLRKTILQNYPIGEVWGIGYRLEQRLQSLGVFTAWDFHQLEAPFIRKRLGVVAERMLFEMQGISCLDVHEPESKKSITCSRSFGKIVKEPAELAEALSTFVSSAAVRLRSESSLASALLVYLEALQDAKAGTRFQTQMITTFPQPTNDTPEMITAAKLCLSKLYSEKEKYKKCGVILLDLIPEASFIPDLFLGGLDPKRQIVMQTVDRVNAIHGKNTLFFGALGVSQSWKANSKKASAYNTTDWRRLPIVKAK